MVVQDTLSASLRIGLPSQMYSVLAVFLGVGAAPIRVDQERELLSESDNSVAMP